MGMETIPGPNYMAPTAPVGDSSNRAASTQFVALAVTSSTAILGETNTWTGDQYFKSGRPWADVRAYGALGDGVTDDTTAIHAARDALISISGGILFFPPGTYLTASGISIDTSVNITIMGAGILNTYLVVGTNNVTVLTLGNGRHSVHDIAITGYGYGAGGNSHALHLKSTCVDVHIERCYIFWGFYCVFNEGVDTQIAFTNIIQSYGQTMLNNTSVALWMIRCKMDSPWPGTTPTYPTTVSAWTNNHVYTLGTVVSTQGYFIQCTTAGTSGSSAPTLQNYYVPITDGTAVWGLACPTPSSSLEITSGSSECHIFQCDFSGAWASSCIRIDNDAAGTAPYLTSFTDNIFSQSYGSCFDVIAGSGLMVSGNEIFGGFQSGSACVALRSAWAGDASLVDNIIIGGGAPGIYLGSGTNVTITGNNIFNCLIGVSVDAGVSQFIISSNNIGSSAKWGANTAAVTVAVGGSDYYNIVNNIVHGAGAGVTDGGTGTHKTLTGNN